MSLAKITSQLARLPRNRRSLVCVGVFTVAGQVGLAAMPFLVDNAAFLLLMLRPRTEVIVLLEDRLPAPVILLVAIPLRISFHISYFELGRWGGDRLISRFRFGRWLLAMVRKPGFAVVALYSCLISQSSRIDMLLGAQNVPRRHVYLILTAGTLVWTTVLVVANEALPLNASGVVDIIVEHRVLFACATAGVALIFLMMNLVILRKVSRLQNFSGNQEVMCNDDDKSEGLL